MKTINGMLTSILVLVGTVITGCATMTDQSRAQCANDYTCLSDNAFKYRQQAERLSALAQRYELEATAMSGQDAESVKHQRDLAQTYRSEAQQADELAQEYRRQLPHNMAH
jgi:uncharacterized protein YxeA